MPLVVPVTETQFHHHLTNMERPLSIPVQLMTARVQKVVKYHCQRPLEWLMPKASTILS